MIFFTHVAAPILVSTAALAHAEPMKTEAQAVSDLDTQYQKAVEQNDAETMDKILADDFVLVTGLGKTYTKTDLLTEARSKRIIYEVQSDSRRSVRIWGNTAVVTALLSAKGTEEGKPFDYQVWFSDIYLKTEKGWRYVFAQSSMRIKGNATTMVRSRPSTT